VVGVPALFLNLDVVISLTSIGTLFAFVLVSAGVLVLNQLENKPESKFKVPFINGKYIFPIFVISGFIAIQYYFPGYYSSILTLEFFPMVLFFIAIIIIAVLTFLKNFSLIPVLGFTSCFYLMAQESHTNWFRFIIWLAVGLIVYFGYSYKNSKLNKADVAEA
jgi:amino acid transporter